MICEPKALTNKFVSTYKGPFLCQILHDAEVHSTDSEFIAIPLI